MDTQRSEFEEMIPVFGKALLASILVIPLRFADAGAVAAYFGGRGIGFHGLETPDITSTVKKALNPDSKNTSLRVYDLPAAWLGEFFPGGRGAGTLYVSEKELTKPDPGCAFRLGECRLWLFPQAAFLCVGLWLRNHGQLDQILHPGYVKSRSRYYIEKDGGMAPFSLDESIRKAIGAVGAEPFYSGEGDLFLEVYPFSLAWVDQKFRQPETIRALSFCLLKMAPLTRVIDDPALSDVKYVCGAKEPVTDTCSWGCCTSLEGVAYVRHRDGREPEDLMREQLTDTLPVILLVLYQKYTCLSFTERITGLRGDKGRKLKRLRQDMLEFRAFGTVPVASISRWINIQDFYTNLMDIHGVPEAIESIDDKLEVLFERRNERRSLYEGAIGIIISLFGILSLAEPMQIIKDEVLLSGSKANLLYYGVTVFLPLLAVILLLALFNLRRK